MNNIKEWWTNILDNNKWRPATNVVCKLSSILLGIFGMRDAGWYSMIF
jgi:hypothetical protein